MAKAKKPRLGRGLSSLMSTPVSVQPPPPPPPAEESPGGPSAPSESAPAGHAEDSRPADPGLVYLGVDTIEPNRFQPRAEIDEKTLAGLASSIEQDGLMQPVIVRPAGDDGHAYELVAGERRWRAARLAGLDRIPALVRPLDDRQLAEWAIVENLQREDLDPIERAQAFRRLIDQFQLSHDEVARRVGSDRSTISNLLRLLELNDYLRAAIRTGQLTAGHGRALLGISDEQLRQALAEKAMAGRWSVRQVESAVRRAERSDASPTERRRSARSRHLRDLEEQIGRQLQTKVAIRPGKRKGSGTLCVEFYDLDQFDTLLSKLGVDVQ